MAIYLLELMDLIRQRLDDTGGNTGAAPHGYYTYWQSDDSGCLWKNTELVRYIKQALLDIGLRAPITEEGSDLDSTVGTVTANDPYVEIEDPRVLTVEQVRLVSANPPNLLTKTTSARLTAQYGSPSWTTLTGTPTHYLEPQRGYLYLFPIPTSADTVRMVVRRGYSTDFDWTDIADEETPTTELEDIDEWLFEALVQGACKYAYQKRDADTFNAQLAQACEQQLIALVGPPVSMRQREARRENANLNTALRSYPYTSTASTADEDWP